MVFFNDVLINLMMVAAIKKAETKDPTLEKKYGIILITGAGQVLTEFLYASSEERASVSTRNLLVMPIPFSICSKSP